MTNENTPGGTTVSDAQVGEALRAWAGQRFCSEVEKMRAALKTFAESREVPVNPEPSLQGSVGDLITDSTPYKLLTSNGAVDQAKVVNYNKATIVPYTECMVAVTSEENDSSPFGHKSFTDSEFEALEQSLDVKNLLPGIVKLGNSYPPFDRETNPDWFMNTTQTPPLDHNSLEDLKKKITEDFGVHQTERAVASEKLMKLLNAMPLATLYATSNGSVWTQIHVENLTVLEVGVSVCFKAAIPDGADHVAIHWLRTEQGWVMLAVD